MREIMHLTFEQFISSLLDQLPCGNDVALFSKRGSHSKPQHVYSTDYGVRHVNLSTRVDPIKQLSVQQLGVARLNFRIRVEPETHQREPYRHYDLEPRVGSNEPLELLGHSNIGPYMVLKVFNTVATKHEP
ncbi:hypothetical protein TorRG33x02_266480 [Trema orientale]|uniref:Uncharacterized protein n=1 Tax=Trema orientale TaxID=63057 RepID=A0A2P5D0Y5_TREOI|nr:hypothetical protein TorRG33x02_266480 [Trema orientale]